MYNRFETLANANMFICRLHIKWFFKVQNYERNKEFSSIMNESIISLFTDQFWTSILKFNV